jgi:hypothetical protein
MNPSETNFFVTGGTLRHDAPCYVERQADNDLLEGLSRAEFCYVLTSRQMGKSSLMVRTANKLRESDATVVVLDLTAIGQNLTPEQWYDGLLLRLGRQLQIEDELDAFWRSHDRVSPVQRFMAAIRDVALTKRAGALVIFVDEIDVVRSLPFATDEFFAAIRECYNRRVEEPELNRLTFCLLGVATPAELIRDARTTPFNIGKRIELADFTEVEAAPLAQRLAPQPKKAEELLKQIFHWTNGHPYLSQTFCKAVADGNRSSNPSKLAVADARSIDLLCEKLFLSPRAREQDDNLLFVRERILRSEADLAKLLRLYGEVHKGERIRDDETDDLINQLRLAGIVDVAEGHLRVRIRIYFQVFDQNWVAANVPDAEVEKSDGERIRIDRSCTLGRASSSDVVLPDQKVSRRHALIQAQKQYEFWLMDLGSSNGTFLNGRRVTEPALLRNQDQIEIGPFRLTFRQSKTSDAAMGEQTSFDRTIFYK